MGDFYQNGLVTTLHNFHNIDVEELEIRLKKFAKKRPMGLIIPSLASEMETPALKNKYLCQIKGLGIDVY